MTWFGKSEEELKKWQHELDTREKEINIKKNNLDLKEIEISNKDKIIKEKLEELTQKDAELIRLESEIAQRELNAKNNYVKEQRKTFKEAIEIQLMELNSREKELENKQEDIDLKFAKLKKLEGNISQRERTIKEAELEAENGFAEKNRIALCKIEKREIFCKDLEQNLKLRENELLDRIRKLEQRNDSLSKREFSIREAEIKRDKEFSKERNILIDELTAKRTSFVEELSIKRQQEFNKLEMLLAKEEQSRLATLENSFTVLRQQHEILLKKEQATLANEKEFLINERVRLDELKDELEYQKQRLKSREKSLYEREENLNEEINIKIEGREYSFESEKTLLKVEIARLRESIKNSDSLISNFEELKRKLGDEDPATILLKLKTYEEEINILRDDLMMRPTQEMQNAFDHIKSEKEALQKACEYLSDENTALKNSARSQSDFEMQIIELSDKNKSLQRRFESVEADNNRLTESLKRLQSSYEREQDREARIRDIEMPYIQKELSRYTDEDKKATMEIPWLENISKSCIEYGLKFPQRILYAFHTALKTSEWSPLTVLAGVSGTGKSELPRLYSHFGGINFLSLSVQPNWDSQESMLGFFNSIDNKFDAQPILRLLAQCQKTKSEVYPFGLEDVMSLILMDEMNLAHVELYFAEFLSKLELRRGCKGKEVPNLEVKLGAGIQHYPIPLGRNVLWVGTMNQDETTKSLSDKVLDRGIVINFPSPTKLERRKKLKPLGQQGALLPRKLWENWWCRETNFSDDQIKPYKGFVEEMNTSLSKVGRALGHRVWQSIEFYMSNYPDVMEAQRNKDATHLEKSMKVAFEDQLVQKVMPKLRGIETRGKSKSDCLDKIRTQLVKNDYTIIEDYDLACEFGYGQFIWNSANYLKDTDNFISQDEINLEESTNDSQSYSGNSEDEIPDEIYKYTEKNSKEVWQITVKEIIEVLDCKPQKATQIKEACNCIRNIKNGK